MLITVCIRHLKTQSALRSDRMYHYQTNIYFELFHVCISCFCRRKHRLHLLQGNELLNHNFFGNFVVSQIKNVDESTDLISNCNLLWNPAKICTVVMKKHDVLCKPYVLRELVWTYNAAFFLSFFLSFF